MIRAALVLHLFHFDVALDLIERIARINAPVDLFATHVGPLPPAVRAALERVPHSIEVAEVPNLGWDIGPLFGLLPRLAAGGYEVIGKLHTKDVGTAAGARWQQLACEGLIASDALVAGILARFAEHPGLALLGPRALYKSVAVHLFGNDELLSDLARRLVAPAYPPADWGFFAGSSFWTRRALLERMAPLAELDAPSTPKKRDGTPAHAMERLFGLASLICGGLVGLVEHGRIQLASATALPSREPILQTLLGGPSGAEPVEPATAALIARHNPLLDYIRHGRDADALDPNLHFSTRWYNENHKDVRAAGMHPLAHYITHGAAENRLIGRVAHHNPLLDYIRHGRDADALDPNPRFSSQWYNSAYRDVFDAGFHPLRHYIEHGAAEKRPTVLATAPVRSGDDPADEIAGERPRRFYQDFDLGRERTFLHSLAQRPAGTRARAGQLLVSVVMPAFNGAERIAAAIRSVLAQTHQRLELLIVDDGSTDDTAAVAATFAADPRVRLTGGPHHGVCAARNFALAASRGEIIAYLDCDNRWKPWYLEIMVGWLTAEALDIGYCAVAQRGDGEQLIGYRGDDFDWAACLAANYIDLNSLCHRRALVDQLGGFDVNLRRMVDWDLILRYGRDRRVGYAPFVGCEYYDGKVAGGRITLREPGAFQALVRAKHQPGQPSDLGRQELAAGLRLAFAIKVAAPEAEKQAWGDYHFAERLRAAIERLGHSARIDFRDQWYGHPFASEDVVIVLRGLIPYEPQPGRMCFIWAISHPDQIDWAEYDRYSRIYAGSVSYAALLSTIVAPPVRAMLQATDPARFHPLDDAPDAPEVLFVGNSRGVDREMVRWAFEAARPPEIYGDGWAGRVPQASVKAANVDNASLGGFYAGAGVVLNDHWPSMRAFGLLANRLFDVVASGGRVVSDHVPSMAAVFGDAVHTVAGAADLARTVGTLLGTPRDRAREREASARVHASHSFDARARVLVRDAFAILGLDAPVDPAPAAPDLRLHVHVVAPHAPAGPQSSAFIRLVAPLTDDEVASRIRLSIGPAGQAVPECDVCIVQRTALPDTDAADALVRRVAALGAVLVTDVDDAFPLIDASHPEHDVYRPLAAALDRVVAASAETWFSTTEVARAYATRTDRAAIVSNAIDPRLWRNWRHPRGRAFTEAKVRMLYMGTHTHGGDFALIRPALERFAEAHGDAFSLTLVGIASDIAPAPWLHRLFPPAGSTIYPRFARWLREQGPFDLGLAPLADTPFNCCKSDLKCLDYAALGLLPLLSDAPAYRADPDLAQFALFASNEESWFQVLCGVLRNRDDAARRAAALQAHVWEERSVPRTARQLLGRLEALHR